MRLFVADAPDGDWSELTHGGARAVRVVARDLAQAQRMRTRIRTEAADEIAVILDVTVAVAVDFRSARADLADGDGVHYVGTVDGLAGLVADIETAGVADGVTLIAVTPQADVRALGRDVLRRLALRSQPRAS